MVGWICWMVYAILLAQNRSIEIIGLIHNYNIWWWWRVSLLFTDKNPRICRWWLPGDGIGKELFDLSVQHFFTAKVAVKIFGAAARGAVRVQLFVWRTSAANPSRYSHSCNHELLQWVNTALFSLHQDICKGDIYRNSGEQSVLINGRND